MRRAFTLIEVMIVTAIIALLVISLTLSVTRQREKADDAVVKADLERLKIAFEDYYSDHNCYPPATSFDSPDDCGSDNLAPYLGAQPCDPKTDVPYPVEFVPDQCGGYRIFATLENTDDPESVALQGPGGSNLGNYGVASSNTTVTVLGPASHDYYWCSAPGNCTSYNPTLFSCTPSWTDDPNCGSGCFSTGSCSAN